MSPKGSYKSSSLPRGDPLARIISQPPMDSTYALLYVQVTALARMHARALSYGTLEHTHERAGTHTIANACICGRADTHMHTYTRLITDESVFPGAFYHTAPLNSTIALSTYYLLTLSPSLSPSLVPLARPFGAPRKARPRTPRKGANVPV